MTPDFVYDVTTTALVVVLVWLVPAGAAALVKFFRNIGSLN